MRSNVPANVQPFLLSAQCKVLHPTLEQAARRAHLAGFEFKEASCIFGPEVALDLPRETDPPLHKAIQWARIATENYRTACYAGLNALVGLQTGIPPPVDSWDIAATVAERAILAGIWSATALNLRLRPRDRNRLLSPEKEMWERLAPEVDGYLEMGNVHFEEAVQIQTALAKEGSPQERNPTHPVGAHLVSLGFLISTAGAYRSAVDSLREDIAAAPFEGGQQASMGKATLETAVLKTRMRLASLGSSAVQFAIYASAADAFAQAIPNTDNPQMLTLESSDFFGVAPTKPTLPWLTGDEAL